MTPKSADICNVILVIYLVYFEQTACVWKFGRSVTFCNMTCCQCSYNDEESGQTLHSVCDSSI